MTEYEQNEGQGQVGDNMCVKTRQEIDKAFEGYTVYDKDVNAKQSGKPLVQEAGCTVNDEDFEEETKPKDNSTVVVTLLFWIVTLVFTSWVWYGAGQKDGKETARAEQKQLELEVQLGELRTKAYYQQVHPEPLLEGWTGYCLEYDFREHVVKPYYANKDCMKRAVPVVEKPVSWSAVWLLGGHEIKVEGTDANGTHAPLTNGWYVERPATKDDK